MTRQLLVQQALNIMGLKQYEMALFMKVDRSAVSKWINGIDHFDDARVFQLKYYVEKNIGKKRTDLLFKDIVRGIDLGIKESFSISPKSRIRGAKLMQELCNEKYSN